MYSPVLDVSAASKSVVDNDAVVARGVELSPRLVRDRHLGELHPALEGEGRDDGDLLLDESGERVVAGGCGCGCWGHVRCC